MSSLRRQAEREGRCVFSTGELTSLANELALAVRDVAAFLEQLNESGELGWVGGRAGQQNGYGNTNRWLGGRAVLWRARTHRAQMRWRRGENSSLLTR